MKIASKLYRRVHRLDQNISDFEEMFNREELKKQSDVLDYIMGRLKDLKEKREEYIICIRAINYLEEHLQQEEFQKLITSRKDAID